MDSMEEAGPSGRNGRFSNGSTRMDIDGDDFDFESSDSGDESGDSLQNLDEGSLKNFCKKASTAFFDQHGLISHQINSYNEFTRHGIQRLFDSIGEIVVEPGYDKSKKGDEDGAWRRASLRFGKVTLERPKLCPGDSLSEDGVEKVDLVMLPRHARLQNMSYAAKINVDVQLEVYTISRSRSDKFKTGVEDFVQKRSVGKYHSNVSFGKLPVMVKSDLCNMTKHQKDCEFDEGGYFVIKGAEKTFIAQEQICLKRLWVDSDPTWTVAHRSGSKRERVYMKLVPKLENCTGSTKVLTVYFLGTEVPIWLLFFALGVPNDREVVKLVDLNIEDCRVANILLESIYDADNKCEGFRRGANAANHIAELMKGCKFPPTESVDECIRMYLFPTLKSFVRI